MLEFFIDLRFFMVFTEGGEEVRSDGTLIEWERNVDVLMAIPFPSLW